MINLKKEEGRSVFEERKKEKKKEKRNLSDWGIAVTLLLKLEPEEIQNHHQQKLLMEQQPKDDVDLTLK